MVPKKDPVFHSTLDVGKLCNNASLPEETESGKERIGDPTEIALLVAAVRIGLDREAILVEKPEVREVAIDPGIEMMTTFQMLDSRYKVAWKGAPEPVPSSSETILTTIGEHELMEVNCHSWEGKVYKMAQKGVIGFSAKYIRNHSN